MSDNNWWPWPEDGKPAESRSPQPGVFPVACLFCYHPLDEHIPNVRGMDVMTCARCPGGWCWLPSLPRSEVGWPV